MKALIILSLSVMLVAFMGTSSGTGPDYEAKRVTVEQLGQDVQLIGKLGKSVGSIVEVRASIVDGASLRVKALQDRRILKIDSVDGEPLKQPCYIEYRIMGGNFKNQPKLGAVGSYIGYETGEFVGIPTAAFKRIKPVSAESYHFRSYFVVLPEE